VREQLAKVDLFSLQKYLRLEVLFVISSQKAPRSARDNDDDSIKSRTYTFCLPHLPRHNDA
jgi:hypothetical protein